MKFRPGDLVEIKPGVTVMRQVDGQWQRDFSPRVGVVTRELSSTGTDDPPGQGPRILYEVMVGGKLILVHEGSCQRPSDEGQARTTAPSVRRHDP